MILIQHHHAPEKPIRSCRDSKRGCVKPASAPGVFTKVKHAAQASSRVVQAVAHGDPVRVSAKERERRLCICKQCEYWRDGGNLGLGECRHSECGCTRIKHKLATEACPLNKWQLT